MSLFDSASVVITPSAYKASKLYAIKPTDGSGDLTVTRATTARRVNSAGLIESVANNVPRLDYTNSTCPSLLVEPQRTNLLLRSQEIDNASWTKVNATVTVNNTTSPDGNLTADKLVENTSSSTHYIQQTGISFVSGTSYTLVFYAKAGERNSLYVGLPSAAFTSLTAALFNLSTGTIGTTNNSPITSITPFGNGWYRCSITKTATITATSSPIFYMVGSTGTISYTGNGTSGIYIWGAQLEAGANATSYIPTTTASVTRNADVISKTGISSLIGQTEGTLFADVNVKNLGIPTRQIFNLTSGTPNFVNLSFLNTNVLRVTIRANGGTQYNVSTSALPIGRYKLAATYKAGELKLYVNGVLIGTNTNASVSWSSALDRLNLDNSVLGGENFSDGINLVSHWKTVLTNEECINLTTI